MTTRTDHAPAPALDSDSGSDDAIAARAFELWERAGQPTHMEFDFWMQAENELRREHRHRPPVRRGVPTWKRPAQFACCPAAGG